MKIGFVGGGTGGHFYPLIAVADTLNKSQFRPQLYYFGPDPYNQDELVKQGVVYVPCPAGKLRLYFSVQNIVDTFRNFFGVFVAVWKLYVIYPDVIFSKGGYTSVPILIAARLLMIPVVIHESDVVPGRASKLARSQARYIGIAYDDAAKFFSKEKTALVGIPLRPEFKNFTGDPFVELGIPNDKPLIYVTGGSQGAVRLNDFILRSLEDLLPDYRIFHQTGSANVKDLGLSVKALLQESPLLENYYLVSDVDGKTMTALMHAASLIITRAGSTTLFEIAYVGKPSIIVPIPEDISRDQRSNAYAYARSGGAVVIEEGNLSPDLLVQEIRSILGDPTRYQAMCMAAKTMHVDGAAEKIATILISIGVEHGS